MADEYRIGDAPTLVATFHNEAGQLADPDPVQFSYKAPDGVVTQLTQWTAAVPGPDITKLSTGVFKASVPITKSGGYYAWKWQGLGAVKAVKESDSSTALHVLSSGFP